MNEEKIHYKKFVMILPVTFSYIPKTLYFIMIYLILINIMGEIKMKKIMAIFLVGTLLVGISSASAIVLQNEKNAVSKPIQKISKNLFSNKNIGQTSTEGNFSGQFAKKNETGYIILGSINGSYQKNSNYTGTFDGIWNTTDENSSGTMSGWFWGHFYLGEIELENDSYWFVGLYRVNETSNEFYTAAIIFTSPYLIRYAAGTYE